MFLRNIGFSLCIYPRKGTFPYRNSCFIIHNSAKYLSCVILCGLYINFKKNKKLTYHPSCCVYSTTHTGLVVLLVNENINIYADMYITKLYASKIIGL